jgi:hypothetical protein
MGQPNRPPVAYWQFSAEGNDPLPTDAKYTSFEEIERAIAAAKHDLAEKVLTTAQQTALSYAGGSGERLGADGVVADITQVFTESGVAVETKGGEAHGHGNSDGNKNLSR